MPTEFLARAAQRHRDAVQRQMLQELQAIRATVHSPARRGLSNESAMAARVQRLEDQVGFLANALMQMCRSSGEPLPTHARLMNRR